MLAPVLAISVTPLACVDISVRVTPQQLKVELHFLLDISRSRQSCHICNTSCLRHVYVDISVRVAPHQMKVELLFYSSYDARASLSHYVTPLACVIYESTSLFG